MCYRTTWKEDSSMRMEKMNMNEKNKENTNEKASKGPVTIGVTLLLAAIFIVFVWLGMRWIDSTQFGALCLTVRDVEQKPAVGCRIDFLQLSDDPQPSAPVEGCSEPGQYYFDSVPQGHYDVVAFCGEKAIQMRLNLGGDEVKAHGFIQ